MDYNTEKINQIGKFLAEIVAEALTTTRQDKVLIGDVEMAMQESSLETGGNALKYFLEKADEEVETEIECACGGKLTYQRQRDATIWSVFDKVVYNRAYYAGCACGRTT